MTKKNKWSAFWFVQDKRKRGVDVCKQIGSSISNYSGKGKEGLGIHCAVI